MEKSVKMGKKGKMVMQQKANSTEDLRLVCKCVLSSTLLLSIDRSRFGHRKDLGKKKEPF